MKYIKLAPPPQYQNEEYIMWSIERALEFLTASTTMGNERKKHRKEKKKPKKQKP